MTMRRLAAILAADVVGYSRLMEQDEAGTLAALKARRTSILAPLVRQHEGRIVKVMGDGVLVEFASAVNAVACAVELQKRMAAANDGVSEDRRVVLRIGINLGDIMVEGGDLYGDGVNIAARLQELADPGGICVTGKVHDEVRRKLDLAFESAGEQTLKNFAEPLRIYRTGGERERRPTAGRALSPEKPAIAVLPFVNMSGDPEQEYFSDGITEDIITELSRFRSLHVIARNSAFAFKGKAAKVQETAKELGAAYVVEGSVRRVGARIRITAQLIEAAGGTHLWAERYDRPAEEVFAIQDDVVRTVAATLAGRLEAAGAEGLRRRPTASLSAYECVLRGNALPVGDPVLEPIAHQLFEQAVALDPDYAMAHAQLAISYAKQWEDNMSGSSKELDRAFELAMRAVSLDPQEIVCHTALGYIQLCRRRHDEAEFHARKAVAQSEPAERARHPGLHSDPSGPAGCCRGIDRRRHAARPPSPHLVLDRARRRAFRGAAVCGGGRRHQAPSEPGIFLADLSRSLPRPIGRGRRHAQRGGRDHAAAARLLGSRLHGP
jgi:TolB-like protein